MALAEPAASPFHDMMKLHSTSSAFHQDDLWTTCGGYGTENGMLLSSVDELSNMVSMVSSLQGNHRHHHSEAFTSGLHRNASFDSGSTGSHDSTPGSFSTGSPVTVLPPLPFSGCEGKPQEESYTQYVDGLLTGAHDHTSDCDRMLASPGGENFSSLLLNEPLRSYDDGVDQVCGSNDYHLDCMVRAPGSVSSQCRSYQTSDNAGSTPSESSHSGIESNFCQEFLLGQEEFGSDHNRNHQPRHEVGSSANRSVSPPLTSCTAAAPALVESEVSPTTAARRRLSWTDQYWPAPSSTNPVQASLNNLQSTTAAQRLPLPQQFIDGFNGNATQAVTFHDTDYVATCNQYRKPQLQEMTNADGAVNSVNCKRPFSVAMQSACTTAVPAAAASSHSPFLKFGAASNVKPRQDAAALSALLYKNNHGNSDLIQQLQAGSTSSSAGLSAVGTGVARDSMLLPPPKLRRRHGTATDPQSIAARTRRERFSDRIRVLQSLVPNGERLDTVSMLGHTLEYVRFLQHQVWQLYNGSDDPSIPQPDPESREKWKEFMDTQTIS